MCIRDRQDKAKTHERMKKGVMEEVKQIFRPEMCIRDRMKNKQKALIK